HPVGRRAGGIPFQRELLLGALEELVARRQLVILRLVDAVILENRRRFAYAHRHFPRQLGERDLVHVQGRLGWGRSVPRVDVGYVSQFGHIFALYVRRSSVIGIYTYCAHYCTI